MEKLKFSDDISSQIFTAKCTIEVILPQTLYYRIQLLKVGLEDIALSQPVYFTVKLKYFEAIQ